jgi:transposase
MRSGAPWRDLPDNFGPYTTCYNRFVRWRRAGVWGGIMNALAATHDAAVQMIDTSIIRVHQHAACIARNKKQSMGRSRGGLTSKIHALVDANGLPVRLALTAGEAHDNRLAGKLLSRLKSGTMLLADHGYDADWIRALAAEKGGQHPAKMQSQRSGLLQPASLPCSEFGRTVLQQDQAVSAGRDTLRQTRSQLPRLHPACINPALAAR